VVNHVSFKGLQAPVTYRQSRTLLV